MTDRKLHHYVKDKDGNIEMELWYENGKWSVHYPRNEFQETDLRTNTCFTEFCTYQVAMLIFGYNIGEFKRFEKEFKKFLKGD